MSLTLDTTAQSNILRFPGPVAAGAVRLAQLSPAEKADFLTACSKGFSQARLFSLDDVKVMNFCGVANLVKTEVWKAFFDAVLMNQTVPAKVKRQVWHAVNQRQGQLREEADSNTVVNKKATVAAQGRPDSGSRRVVPLAVSLALCTEINPVAEAERAIFNL